MTSAVLMVSLLMVIRVSGCAFDVESDPAATTHRPTEAENRMYHDIRMELIKLRLLKALGIDRPPEIPQGISAVLMDNVRSLPMPNYLSMTHAGHHPEQASSTSHQPARKFSRVIVFAELGSSSPCPVPKSILRYYTPVSFKLPNDPSLIDRAILQFKSSAEKRNHKQDLRVWICSCGTTGNQSGVMPTPQILRSSSNMLDPTLDFRMRDARCHQLSFAEGAGNGATSDTLMMSARKGWSHVQLGDHWKSYVSGSDRRLLFLLDGKMSISERKRPSLVLEVEKETPQMPNYPLRVKREEQEVEIDECATMKKNMEKKDGGVQGTPSSCCRTGFWVDIKELGWSEWILSPPGFYFHFCSGQCRHGFESIVKGGAGLDYFKVMNAVIEKNKLRSIRPCCMPRKRSPLSILMVAGRTSLNRTLIPDFIVDECACIGFS